jgi:hypothetical protein
LPVRFCSQQFMGMSGRTFELAAQELRRPGPAPASPAPPSDPGRLRVGRRPRPAWGPLPAAGCQPGPPQASLPGRRTSAWSRPARRGSGLPRILREKVVLSMREAAELWP